MKNKVFLGFGVMVLVVLTATQAINYSFKEPIPQAVLKAVELGMEKSTAQAMYNDGVAAKDIRPEFVSAWKKDKQGQIEGAKQFKALQARMDNPDLKAAFAILNSDKTKQRLLQKERAAQLKSGDNNKRSSLSLNEIKSMMSNDEFMAYTDVLWHRRTSKPLLNLPNSSNKNLSQQKAATLSVGSACSFPNLLTAINAAQPGDTIIVEAKTFSGADAQLTLNKDLTIIGGYDSTCQVFTANRTVLQTNLFGSVIDIDVSGGKTVSLFGLDISGAQNDGTDYTSGINITGNGFVTIGNSLIHDNESKFGGGLSIQNGADVTVDQFSELYFNDSLENGGGIFCDNSTLTVDDTLIGRFNGVAQGNVTPTNREGAAIYANQCSIALGSDGHPVEVSYNESPAGSIIYLAQSQLTVADENSRISFNDSGSTIKSTNLSQLFVHGVKTTDNQNISTFYTIDSSSLNINSLCTNSPCAEISRNQGSAFFAEDNGNISISQTVIANNGLSQALNIGSVATSIDSSGSSISIQNSMIVNNSNDNVPLFSFDSQNGVASTLSLFHTTIANNDSTFPIIESINGSTVTVNSSIIWGNDASLLQTVGSSGVTVEDSVIQYDPSGMINTLQADPLFIDSANDNWHIDSFSPAVDLSNSNAFIDIDNQPRPQGIKNDAGADENGTKIGINGAQCSYYSIPQAISNATSGDTIYLAKGVFQGQLGVLTKDLNFVSATDDCSSINLSANPSDVTLDGNAMFTTDGGLFKINGSYIKMTNMQLTNAQATLGGLAFIENGTLELTDVSAGNGTANFGGIIDVFTNGNLILNGSTSIFSGFANKIGGGINNHHNVTMNDTSHIGVQDFGNQALLGGAGIHSSSLPINFTMNGSSSIYANITPAFGGGVSFTGSTSQFFTMNDDATIGLSFLSVANKSKDGAGLFINAGDQVEFTMNDQSSIQNNIATKRGAGAYFNSVHASFNSGSIQNNRINSEMGELSYGAGIYATSFDNITSNNITIEADFSITRNQYFDENNPNDFDLSGGGMYAEKDTTIVVNGGQFGFNDANQGGGISLVSGAKLTLNQAEFTSNSARANYDGNAASGGGIYASDSLDIEINESVFGHNSATRGGGIYSQSTNVLINDGSLGTLFEQNNGGNSGGGIDSNDANIEITGPVTFTKNNSFSGGAVYLSSGANITNSKSTFGSLLIDDNTGSLGGGIYADNSFVNLNDGVISNNSTSQIGGGIYFLASNSILENMQFVQNSSDIGGAIYEGDSSFVSILGKQTCLETQIAPNYCSSFTGNSATTSGATIVIEAPNAGNLMQMKHTVIHDNTPNSQGSIFLTGATAQLDARNSLLFNNGPQGIYTSSASEINLDGVTMDNSGLYSVPLNANTIVDNSIIWNTAVTVPIGGVPGNCNISPNDELVGTTDDPLFETALEGPYHLSANSPAVDQCADNNNVIDLDGRARTIDSNGVPNGGFDTDIGAFERPLFGNLIISKFGMGTVVSDLTGIDCGVDCSEAYEIGKTIQLTASPDNGFVFGEWTGACAGFGSVCNITINGLTETDAVFIEEFTVTVSTGGVGPGHVESGIPGINCGAICEGTYLDGSVATLNAIADNNVTTFDHWEGACQGQGASCQLTVDSDKNTQAIFTAPQLLFSDSFED